MTKSKNITYNEYREKLNNSLNVKDYDSYIKKLQKLELEKEKLNKIFDEKIMIEQEMNEKHKEYLQLQNKYNEFKQVEEKQRDNIIRMI